MMTVHTVQLIQSTNLLQLLSQTDQQIKEFSSQRVIKRLDVQKVVAQAKRKRAIRVARGSLAHVPGSVDEFLQRKREDTQRENLKMLPLGASE